MKWQSRGKEIMVGGVVTTKKLLLSLLVGRRLLAYCSLLHNAVACRNPPPTTFKDGMLSILHHPLLRDKDGW